jgi:hypothetical protein
MVMSSFRLLFKFILHRILYRLAYSLIIGQLFSLCLKVDGLSFEVATYKACHSMIIMRLHIFSCFAICSLYFETTRASRHGKDARQS